MQVAEILSDLTSLQVCDPKAALDLVSARPNKANPTILQATTQSEDNDPDLKRAKDLIDLHAGVKMAHLDGTDKELNNARDAVSRVLREL